MKKNTMRWWIILVVLLVVYNVIVFIVPFPKNAVFFISWVFTLTAMGTQVYVIRTTFYHEEGAKSKFYGFPIAKIGIVYLIAQVVLSLVFMALGLAVPVPEWVPLVLYVVLLGVMAAGLISTEATRDEIMRQDVKLKKDVFRMRTLQSKASALCALAQDSQTRTLLERFAEALRFSDPVSNEAVYDVEADLIVCVDELQQAVVDGDTEAVATLERKAESVLAERNQLCKLNKQSTH